MVARLPSLGGMKPWSDVRLEILLLALFSFLAGIVVSLAVVSIFKLTGVI